MGTTKKTNQKVLLFYAPFVLPDDSKFEDQALECRGLLQMVESFQGKRWESLFPKRASKQLAPEESLLAELGIPRSLAPEAKAQLRRSVRAQRGLWIMARDAALSNDTYAARNLVRVAIAAVELIVRAKAKNPGVFAPILRSSTLWPTVVGIGRQGVEGIQQEIAGLGEDFLQRDGFNEAVFEKWQHLPARKWAYAAKTILGWNRMLAFAACEHHKDWLRFKKHLQKQAGVNHIYFPSWFLKCGLLPEFSRSTVPKWMAVGKEMIKDQMPDFDQLEEWKNWDRRAATRTKPGNNPRGKKRNDIFGSIESAMQTIAREDSLPK